MSDDSPNRWGRLAPLGEALRFLTVLPIPGLPPMSLTSISASIPWFPVVGVLLGGLLLPVGAVAGVLWGDLVRAIVLVVAAGILTAGLHLDGLSDTFDAVLSWRPRERKLEIMKDSRIGVMGALALLAVLLLKVGWLASPGIVWWQGVLLAPLWGRWADVYGIVWFPPAREGGLGRTFHADVHRPHFWLATAFAVVVAWLVAGMGGLLAGALVWLVTHWLAHWWVRDLGGLTGDTYGALSEIGEVVTLAVLAASLAAVPLG